MYQKSAAEELEFYLICNQDIYYPIKNIKVRRHVPFVNANYGMHNFMWQPDLWLVPGDMLILIGAMIYDGRRPRRPTVRRVA